MAIKGNLIVVILVVALITGCGGGRDFVKPEPESLTLGKTTPDEILNRFGKPLSITISTMNGVHVKGIIYTKARVVQSHVPFKPEPMITHLRTMSYFFLNNTLVYYSFMSSFSEDSTDFDGSKVAKIKKGETTYDEVVRLMGKINGIGIYPYTPDKDGKMLSYSYLSNTYDSVGGLSEVDTKMLFVFFNSAGIVTDVNYNEVQSFHYK